MVVVWILPFSLRNVCQLFANNSRALSLCYRFIVCFVWSLISVSVLWMACGTAALLRLGIDISKLVWRFMNVGMWRCPVLYIGVIIPAVSLDIACPIYFYGRCVVWCGFIVDFPCTHAVHVIFIVSCMVIAVSTGKMFAFFICYNLYRGA